MIFSTSFRNARWVSIFSLCLFILAFGFALGDRQGLFLALLISFFLVWLFARTNEHNLNRTLNPHWLAGNDSWGLTNKCLSLSEIMKIPAPEVGISFSRTLFACVIAEPFGGRQIVISSAALEELSKDEKDALFVELFAFLLRTQAFRYNLFQMLSELCLNFGESFDGLIGLRGKKVFRLMTLITRPIVLILQRLALPRSAFYEIDESCSQVLPHRIPLAHALWKMNHSAELFPLNTPPGASCFFIVSPHRIEYLKRWGLAHPSVEKRIRRLVGTFPI